MEAIRKEDANKLEKLSIEHNDLPRNYDKFLEVHNKMKSSLGAD